MGSVREFIKMAQDPKMQRQIYQQSSGRPAYNTMKNLPLPTMNMPQGAFPGIPSNATPANKTASFDKIAEMCVALDKLAQNLDSYAMGRTLASNPLRALGALPTTGLNFSRGLLGGQGRVSDLGQAFNMFQRGANSGTIPQRLAEHIFLGPGAPLLRGANAVFRGATPQPDYVNRPRGVGSMLNAMRRPGEVARRNM